MAHGGRAAHQTKVRTGLIWGDEGGGDGGRRGEVAHGGRARGESSVGATKGALFFFLGCLKNLRTGLIWLVTRGGGWGEAWGGGPWRAGKGGDGTREQCGATF